jgi:FMN phosphatase YigB (HAD superfamily)
VTTLLTIFLDDAGTMNDPEVRAGQVRRAVGEFLSGEIGGDAGMWGVACGEALAELWKGYRRTMFGNLAADYAVFRRRWLVEWVTGMCVRRGVVAPDGDTCVDFALRMEAYATRRVRAAYPGVLEAIWELHGRGHVLHTASSEDSAELEGYLEGMGVRRCFGRLYGPDLTGVIKEGPLYYTRILADAGVAPGDALVVDDNPLVIGWAAAAGARTARIGAYGGDWPEPDLQLTALAELPDAIRLLDLR